MDGRKNIIRDFGIIVLSVLIAVLLAKTGAISQLLQAAEGMKIIGSFLAGILFVPVFTVAPATVVIAEIAKANSLFPLAFFGGLGALFGDFIIFRFMRDRVSEDFLYLMKKSGFKKMSAIFKFRFLRWLLPILGAIVIASPLPDEIGLAMMGLAKIKTPLFAVLSFSMNFLGILAIGLIARAI